MTKAPMTLQDLQRKIYAKAKANPSWRFWGLYVHVCKVNTLRTAYEMAKANDGAPGIDGVTFDTIEEGGVDDCIGPCGTGSGKFQRRERQKCEPSPSPLSATAWSREP